MNQKRLVTGKLLLYRLDWHLAYSLLNLVRLKCLDEFFGDVEDVAREERPLALTFDQRVLRIVLLFLEHNVMLLQQQHFFLKILHLRALKVDASSVSTVFRDMKARALLKVCVPVEDLWACAFWHIGHQELFQFVP